MELWKGRQMREEREGKKAGLNGNCNRFVSSVFNTPVIRVFGCFSQRLSPRLFLWLFITPHWTEHKNNYPLNTITLSVTLYVERCVDLDNDTGWPGPYGKLYFYTI